MNNDPHKTAQDILKTIEKNYVSEHEYQDVSEKEFGHLDLNFYSRNTQKLNSLGYTYLADIEDLTLNKADEPAMFFRIMIRTLLSADNTIMVGLYHPKMKWWASALATVLRARPGKIIDFETEFSDGTFITTSNAKVTKGLTSPPRITSQLFGKRTSCEKLAELHTSAVSAYLMKHPEVAPVEIRTHDEMIASQNRLSAIKALYRGAIGSITKEELIAFSGGNRKFAEEVWQKIQANKQKIAS